MAEGNSNLSLAVEVRKGGELVNELVSDKEELIIGSDPSADVVLEGDGVEAVHAVLSLNDEEARRSLRCAR